MKINKKKYSSALLYSQQTWLKHLLIIHFVRSIMYTYIRASWLL